MSANATTAASAGPAPRLKYFRRPRTVIMRFVARRTLRSATFVALAFGTFVVSKTVGYADAYPTLQERLNSAALYVHNAGLIALYGTPHHIESVANFAAWYTMCIGVLLGSIWAYLVATKTFRGEEAAGRWELLLVSQTTARRGAANALAGLGISLAVFFVIGAGTLVAVGQMHNINVAAGPALYLALSAVSSAVVFMAVGAFTSQLMPTRARAAGLATGIFGVSYLMRAAGDITDAHWLLNITPLGWIEQLQPISDPQPLWFVPIFALVAALVAGTIWLAGRRDLGASVFADHDTARARTLLLSGPLTSAIRFTRGSTVAWLAGLTTFMLFFGTLTNTVAQAFSGSPSAQHILERLANVAHEAAARTFLGIAFMFVILIIMSYVASAVGAMRADEAEGYLDNLLVRRVSRQQWLWGRAGLIVVGIVLAGFLAAAASYIGMAGHPNGITLADLWAASLNALAPAIFTLGLGLLAFGFVPRYTTIIAYGVIAWSLMVQLISSGLNLSHWILDTSIFNYVSLAPAVDPKWGNDWAMVAVGLVLAILGAIRFNQRDLANE